MDLIKEVTEDLQASAFASEMKAVHSFLLQNWICSGNSGYYDNDEEKIETIDIYASTHESLEKNGKKIFSTFYIVGEVEKSEGPWVVWKGVPELLDHLGHLVYCEGPVSQQIIDIATTGSLLAKLEWCGQRIYESFKKSNNLSTWYSAFLATVKAGEFLFNQEIPLFDETTWDDEDQATSDTVVLQLLQPIVILDGHLFLAELDKSGNTEISEIDSAPMVFSYRSKHYKGNHRATLERKCYVDLVHIDALPSYIDASKKRQKAMTQEIYERLIRKSGP
jgi:hypothetical protein